MADEVLASGGSLNRTVHLDDEEDLYEEEVLRKAEEQERELRYRRASFHIGREYLDDILHGRLRLPASYVVVDLEKRIDEFGFRVHVVSFSLDPVEPGVEGPRLQTAVHRDPDSGHMIIEVVPHG